jgi:hypothetical protein
LLPLEIAISVLSKPANPRIVSAPIAVIEQVKKQQEEGNDIREIVDPIVIIYF